MIVFPAPAGMNRVGLSRISISWRVPRARGDEPLLKLVLVPAPTCSPRPRG